MQMRWRLALLVLIAATAHADVVRILDDPRDAAQAKVEMIQQVRSEIDAVYFLARNDRITLSSLALLRDARRRGVARVRLIVDANFQHIPRAVLAYLIDEGLQIRVYHPLTLRHPSWIFRRMHDKVVGVDGERYITGGRNLAEGYFGLAPKTNFVDRDVYIEGPSAADAGMHFENLWNSAHVADLRVDHVRLGEKQRAAELLEDARADLERNRFIALDTGRDWSAGQKDVPAVRFLHDPSGDGPRVADSLVEILEKAKQSIVIETPYLVPSRDLRDVLRRKLSEGVHVLILTNSLRSTDGVLPYAGFLKYRHWLIHAGVDVREYKGPDTLHAKSAVIDGRITLVGSYNVDPRSANLNTEVMCVAEDAQVARQLLTSIDAHLRNSWSMQRTREWHVPRAMSFRTWAARLFLPLYEGQL